MTLTLKTGGIMPSVQNDQENIWKEFSPTFAGLLRIRRWM